MDVETRSSSDDIIGEVDTKTYEDNHDGMEIDKDEKTVGRNSNNTSFIFMCYDLIQDIIG